MSFLGWIRRVPKMIAPAPRRPLDELFLPRPDPLGDLLRPQPDPRGPSVT